MLQPNDQVGPYKLLQYLGSGAFGEVWLAEKETAVTKIRVALKLPRKTDVDLDTVKQEAAIWEQAKGHPNVLPLIDADIYRVGEQEYVGIASEYADGGSLKDWLEKHGGKAPTTRAAVEMCAGILSGLAHLHARHIVHRDLKPENIMLQGETPRLTDFGLARVLKAGVSSHSQVSGTPLYMAPEAFDGKRSARSDVWSVGVIFYQMLTGRLPFAGPDMMVLMKAILMDTPAPLPPEVPQNLRLAVDQALQKEAPNRLASASAMRAALLETADEKSFADTLEITVTDEPPPPTLASIRAKMLTAHSAWELREALHEVGQFLARNPHHPEAQMLRENINRALTREVALAAPPTQMSAPYAAQAPPPPVMAKAGGGWWKIMAGGGLVAALFVGVIGVSLIAFNSTSSVSNNNSPANTNRPVTANTSSNLPVNVASNSASNLPLPRATVANGNTSAANSNTGLPAGITVHVTVSDELLGRVINLPRPGYPNLAEKARVFGKFEVSVVIDSQGRVVQANAVTGSPLLESVALDAARRAQFSPGPETVGVITYGFRGDRP
jgi:TonB family protein